MKDYYCVTTTCFDDGRITASITDTKRASEKPKSEKVKARRANIYNDWYETFEAAQKAVYEARTV